MIIGERLRQLREHKKLSQGDIERKTGLLRCYISRVENGHTVPNVETLQKFAHALEVPMYKLFYDSDIPPSVRGLSKPDSTQERLWGVSGKDAHTLSEFRRLFSRLKETDLDLVLHIARKLVQRKVLT